jgi:hypothetical protein
MLIAFSDEFKPAASMLSSLDIRGIRITISTMVELG